MDACCVQSLAVFELTMPEHWGEIPLLTDKILHHLYSGIGPSTLSFWYSGKRSASFAYQQQGAELSPNSEAYSFGMEISTPVEEGLGGF